MGSRIDSNKVCLCCSIVGYSMRMASPRRAPYSSRHLEGGGSPRLPYRLKNYGYGTLDAHNVPAEVCSLHVVLFSARLTLDHHAASLLTSKRWRYIDLTICKTAIGTASIAITGMGTPCCYLCE